MKSKFHNFFGILPIIALIFGLTSCPGPIQNPRERLPFSTTSTTMTTTSTTTTTIEPTTSTTSTTTTTIEPTTSTTSTTTTTIQNEIPFRTEMTENTKEIFVGDSYNEDTERYEIFQDYQYYDEWISSNPAVATVDIWGQVTGVSSGTAKIYGSYTDYDDNWNPITVYSYRIITVKPCVVTDISLDKELIFISVEDNATTVAATVSPEIAEDKTLSWDSSNDTIATVNNGEITAIQTGITTITATSSSGVKKSLKVIVLPNGYTSNPSTELTDGFITDESNKIAYQFGYGRLCIEGNINSNWESGFDTNNSYRGQGLSVFLNNSDEPVSLTADTFTDEDLSFTVKPVINNNKITVLYILTNNGNSELTNQKFSVFGRLPYSYTFSETKDGVQGITADFTVSISSSGPFAVTPNYIYSSDQQEAISSFAFNENGITELSNCRPEFSYSWTDITLKAGETKIFGVEYSFDTTSTGNLDAVIY